MDTDNACILWVFGQQSFARVRMVHPAVPAASSHGEMVAGLGIWAVFGYDLEMITFGPWCRSGSP